MIMQTMETMRIREIPTLQTSTHHEVSDVPICSSHHLLHGNKVGQHRIRDLDALTKTTIQKPWNSMYQIIHPKAHETTPSTTRRRLSVSCQPNSYPPKTNENE